MANAYLKPASGVSKSAGRGVVAQVRRQVGARHGGRAAALRTRHRRTRTRCAVGTYCVLKQGIRKLVTMS